MKELRGKNALITGASRGIGPTIACALAGEGMNLILTARHLPALEQAAADARKRGVRVSCYPADLLSPSDLAALVDRAETESGGVAVLVNNAAMELARSYELIEVEKLTDVVSLNLLAPMILCRLLLPSMIRRREGHIVNISSLSGLIGTPYEESYAASKHGLVGFSRSLRMSLRSDGHPIGVSVICPAPIRGAGMYESASAVTGTTALATIGSIPVPRIGRAVVRAIVSDQPEVVLSGMPILPFLMTQVVSPRLAEKIVVAAGAPRMFKRWATASVRTRDPAE